MSNVLHVNAPFFWWVAQRSDLPLLSSPNPAEVNQRWPDRGSIRWDRVGQAIEHVREVLESGDFTLCQHRNAVLECNLSSLTTAEQSIVRSWFHDPKAPTVDPWNEMTDGRHRLWSVWAALPEARLPLRSGVLKYASRMPVTQSAIHGLRRLSVRKGFDRANPINGRYIQSLTMASEGHVFGAAAGNANEDPPCCELPQRLAAVV